MGFLDFVSDAGLLLLERWLSTRSYIVGYSPSQADVKCFQSLKTAPEIAQYPHAARWYKHIKTYQSDFSSLPGDSSKALSAYGPEETVTINPSKAPAGPTEEKEQKEEKEGKEEKEEEEDDDDIDLFGSDDEEEDAEAARVREERLAEYNKKKAGKVKPAAKSIVTMDVKPWDDETDLKQLEANVRAIEKEGLVWGGSKLVAVGFGIKKLQINLVVEDDKVSTDELQQQIEEDEDHVQSTDIVAMQKL